MAPLSNAGPVLPLNEIQSHNRNSVPPTPVIPYHSQPPMQQPPSYSAMFNKVVDARIRAGSGSYEFYTDEDVQNNSSKGWPSMAATQADFPNRRSQRIFRASTQQVLTWYQQRIHCIDNRLDEMNFEDSEAEGKPLRSLPFDQKKFLARCIQGVGHLPPDLGSGELDRATQRDNLIESKESLLRRYFELLHRSYDNMKFPRVSRRAHQSLFDHVRAYDKLDNEALAFMRYIDDFISDAPDPIFQKFESILYPESEWVNETLKRICSIFCGNTSQSSEPGDTHMYLRLRSFTIFTKTLLVLSCLSLVAIPVSLLYLQTQWSRGAYLIVVIISSGIFAIIMSIFEPRTSYMFVGLAAYVAVLVSFISNLSDCECTVAV
ncbi:uncharacterized protein GGS22DRAFT_188454 [Annulohypoxylon maeteangense]|uniref:uncharacterized protein n=1 Tax=Annulohypoxylon maeteangense TaxID=1927788 RepID=UPI0020086F22|nr:uncharacterized protein GGS22DRAFT_188454 [Annulohypoxylon maeteangense]KAI0885163.1 hypothetical protein GGS22DRAFT_188454 [Annulohypoxylon maeteangense]